MTEDCRFTESFPLSIAFAGRCGHDRTLQMARFFRFYVNSWGRDKTQIIASRVGGESPARFLCTAEEDSVSEITEVTYPEADPFQDFGLVVAALNKAI